MDTIPLHLDWLWYLDYDMDSEIPYPSVLSKAFASSFNSQFWLLCLTFCALRSGSDCNQPIKPISSF